MICSMGSICEWMKTEGMGEEEESKYYVCVCSDKSDAEDLIRKV